MKIKKYIYLFAAVGGLTLTACNGMENAPGNQFTDANFWDSPDRAQYVVNMAYAQMYNAGKMWRDESLSDNMIDGRSTTDQRLMRMGQATPTTGILPASGPTCMAASKPVMCSSRISMPSLTSMQPRRLV